MSADGSSRLFSSAFAAAVVMPSAGSNITTFTPPAWALRLSSAERPRICSTEDRSLILFREQPMQIGVVVGRSVSIRVRGDAGFLGSKIRRVLARAALEQAARKDEREI